MAVNQQDRTRSESQAIHFKSGVSSSVSTPEGLKQMPHSVGARNWFFALSVV